MKITKSQLKEIIKEELLKLQEHGGRPYDPTVAGHGKYNVTGDAPPGPPMDLGPPPRGRGGVYTPVPDRNKEELVSALGDVLRRSLDEHGMQPDEVRSAVEEALGVHLGSDMGKIMAHAGQF
tara:strand:- start:212 stop:577 length:366 start_codon:yes stop_codon:yes gene_type:complete